MLVIPLWITLPVAGMVIIFGSYRLKLAFRSQEADAVARKKKGLYGMSRRTHALIGVIYLILGTYLVLMAFGIDPIRLRR